MWSNRNSAEIALRIFGFLSGQRYHFRQKWKFLGIIPGASKQKFLSFWYIFDKKMVRSTLLCHFSGGPFGQKISFNANVFISKMDPWIDSKIQSIIENESRLQNLQCLIINMKVFISKFGRDYVEHFCVFVRPEISFLGKIEIPQNWPMSFQT